MPANKKKPDNKWSASSIKKESAKTTANWSRESVKKTFNKPPKPKSELETFRDLVRHKQKLANQKIRRIEAKGIRVEGSKFDVRRDIKKIASYNRAQLDAYFYELVGFNDRSNAFVKGKAGAPIQKDRWRVYEELEKTVNRTVDAHEKSIGKLKIGPQGVTVEERLAMMGKLKRFDTDNPRAMRRFDRRAEYMKDDRAVELAIKRMRKRADPEAHLLKSTNQAKKNFRKMLRESGANELAKKLNTLEPHQLDLLFGYTSAADTMKRLYISHKEKEETGKEGYTQKWVTDQTNDVNLMLDWVKTVKPMPKMRLR